MMVLAADARLDRKQIKFGIKSAYPFQRFLRRFESSGEIAVWYPWYYITLSVEMDTFLKKGMFYRDLVAVDGLRPIRERLQSYPERKESDVTQGVTLSAKATEEEATEEALDLVKGIVLSRNKLLKDHKITVEKVALVYHKTFVVKLKGRPAEEWLYIDSHFSAATTLKMRPEVRKKIGEHV